MKTKTCTTNIWPLTKTHFEYDTESSVFCVQYTVQTRLTDFTLQNYNFIIQPFRFHSKIQHLIELLFDNCSFRSSRRSWFSTLSLASAHILFLSLSGQQHWKWILGLTFGSDCFKSCSSSSSKLLSSFLFTSWILAFVQTPFGLVKRFLSCMCVCVCVATYVLYHNKKPIRNGIHCFATSVCDPTHTLSFLPIYVAIFEFGQQTIMFQVSSCVFNFLMGIPIEQKMFLMHVPNQILYAHQSPENCGYI